LAVLVEHDLGDFGRRQRIDDESREITAIFAREPGSRATAFTSTMPS